jgi:hypothetical protein
MIGLDDPFTIPPVEQEDRAGGGLWTNTLNEVGVISSRRDSHKIRRDLGRVGRDYSPSSGCDFEMIFD